MKFVSFVILTFLLACGNTMPEKSANNLPDTVNEAFEKSDVPEHDSLPVWSTDYIMGKFEPAMDSNFVLVDRMYADREGLYLRRETYDAFKSMYEAALKDGVKLIIRSATRNFKYQKGIWESKWDGSTPLESNIRGNTIDDETARAREILKYSSMPGSSRHHWGTDMDLNALNNAYFAQGQGKEIYAWLQANAASFGFCQPYSSKETGRPGYQEEKWHWSFTPISNQLTKIAKDRLRDDMISGFRGSEQAMKLSIVENYVLGIDTTCLIDLRQTNSISN